jgi:hypothetical protein
MKHPAGITYCGSYSRGSLLEKGSRKAGYLPVIDSAGPFLFVPDYLPFPLI